MLRVTAPVRWLVGGGAVVVAAAIVIGAIVVLGSRPVPEAMTYVPRTSAVVAELRPDFPGDQLSKVGNLLAHFPGFKDQSILAQKLDQTLAKVTKSATNGSVDWTKQVKPWLAGPLYAGLSPSAAAAATPSGWSGPAGSSAGATSGGGGDYVVVFTTDGTVTCATITPGSTASETYRGVQISEAAPGSSGGSGGTSPGACAIDGRHALVGSLAEVRAALDAHADHRGIDGLADYRTARDRLGGDRLATVYVARAAMSGGAGGLETAVPTLDPALSQAVGSLPAWVIAGIRAEDSALVADLVSAPFGTPPAPAGSVSPATPVATLLTAPPPHPSQLASLVPGDTAALYEVHGAGAALQNALLEARSAPGVGSSLGGLDAALAALGGPAGLLGWVGDAGVVVLPDGSAASGGLVLLAPDASTASAKVDQIRSLLTLAGLGGGGRITITDTTVDGTKVTLADLGDAATLLGSLQTTLGNVGLSIAPGTHVVLSIAAHGSAVIIGSGETFVRRILETASGSTLADQASYRNALALASATNDGQLYVAAAPVLALVEANLPAADKTRFESDDRPYLTQLDALLETTTAAADGVRVRLVLTVK